MMFRHSRRPALFALSIMAAAPALAAQSAITVPAAERRQAVDSLVRSLEHYYVFPEMGNRMAADLRTRLKRGEYDRLTDARSLADSLTAQMQALSHDKHLHVFVNDGPMRMMADDKPSDAERAARETYLRRVNYGFERVERLPGNVGYLELRGFVDPEQGRPAALAALRLLSGSDALIVDLRHNGGGDPGMVALLSSILFPRGEKVHLNDLRWREGDSERVESFYTDPDLDLPRITGEVYVLTSSRTFSAAEEFTYNLKQLKRATQVGETTGGGANPGRGITLADHFGVFLPTGHAVNPVSQDNWEGKGAVPEIAVPAAEALHTAHLRALEHLRARATDPEWQAMLDRAITTTRTGALADR